MTPSPIMFLIGVDNTLLDDDRIQNDLKRHLEREFGAAVASGAHGAPGTLVQQVEGGVMKSPGLRERQPEIWVCRLR